MKKTPNLLKKIIDTPPQGLIVLKYTKTIRQEDVIHSVWQMLKENYKAVEEIPYDPRWRAALTLINSAITHKKVFFAIKRDNLQRMIRDDANYKTKNGVAFSSNEYKGIIAHIEETGLIKVRYPSKGRKPMGIEIVDPDIRSHIVVDVEKQKKELEDFLSNAPEEKEIENIVPYSDKPGELRDGSPLEVEDLLVSTPVVEIKEEKEEPTKDITFKEFLNAKYPSGSSITFDILDSIIDFANTNCNDFDDDIFTVNILIKHFFDRGQKSAAKKKFEASIKDAFQKKLGEFFVRDIELKEPEKRDEQDASDIHSDIMIKKIVARYKARQAKKAKK